MLCPYCLGAHSRVVDTRRVGSGIRRRRECQSCQKRYTTYERVAPLNMMVVKRDGSREPFDREKLQGGIQKACSKRPVPAETIEKLAGQVENDLYALGEREVESEEVGQMVMGQLRSLDDVAYVRFASVYRRFEDINGLADEIKEFRKWKRRRGKSTT